MVVLCYCAYSNSQHNVKSNIIHINSHQTVRTDVSYFDNELSEYHFSSDTLWMISTAEFFFYPFGRYHNVRSILAAYPFMKIKIEPDPNVPEFPVYRFTYQQNYFKVFYDNETKGMELASAKIFDKKISLINQVGIGIMKSDFIRKFTHKITPEQIKNIHVIAFESGLYGVWHYYNFENDTLKYFWFDSGCKVNKN